MIDLERLSFVERHYYDAARATDADRGTDLAPELLRLYATVRSWKTRSDEAAAHGDREAAYCALLQHRVKVALDTEAALRSELDALRSSDESEKLAKMRLVVREARARMRANAHAAKQLLANVIRDHHGYAASEAALWLAEAEGHTIDSVDRDLIDIVRDRFGEEASDALWRAAGTAGCASKGEQ